LEIITRHFLLCLFFKWKSDKKGEGLRERDKPGIGKGTEGKETTRAVRKHMSQVISITGRGGEGRGRRNKGLKQGIVGRLCQNKIFRVFFFNLNTTTPF
jgi:hypothetical protein